MSKGINFDEFLDTHTKGNNLQQIYIKASDELKQSMENVYAACWRFNLTDYQTIYILNSLVQSFV